MVRALINRALIGRRAEAQAAKDYQADGYIIEARNWSCAAGELDVVALLLDPEPPVGGRARAGGLLVFIEVRVRNSDFAGSPIESVTPTKQRKVARAADAYLRARPGPPPENFRFDVVGVKRGEVERIEGAFYPPWAF